MVRTRDTENNKKQENFNFSTVITTFKTKKYVQYKKFNISCYYRHFPSHPDVVEVFEMRGRNNIILHYHYRVGAELGKGVCDICFFHVHAQPVLPNLEM